MTKLLIDAHQLLGADNYAQFGAMAGASKRTVQRWFSRQAAAMPHNYHALARLVHPKNPTLAANLAAAGQTTLAALGIVAATSEPAPPAPAPPPPAPELVVDSLVCAAAEAIELMPAAVRPALLAAFTRARLLGLTVEAVEAGLRAKSVGAPRAEPEEKATTPSPRASPKAARA